MIRINGKDYNSTTNTSSAKSPGFEFGVGQMIDNANIYEPQRTNNFELVIPALNTSMLKAGMTDDRNEKTDYVSNGAEIVRISLAKAFVPSFTQREISVKRGNSTVNYAGVPEFNSGSIELNQYIGAGVYDVLAAWQNQSYNTVTEKVGLADDYKKTIWVCEYTPDYQLVYSWKLYGCWITNLTCSDLTYDNNSIVKITASIKYDRYVPDYSNVSLK